MLTKIVITLAAVLIAATTAQAAAVVHKHQGVYTDKTAAVGKKARASMALMPAAATPTGIDHQSRYRNGAMSAPAGH
jgi:hypothetical protein